MIHNSVHQPVLLKEVIEVLKPKAGEFFIDGTIDGGGHALVILDKIGPEGKLLGIDWDKKMIERLKSSVKGQISNVVLVHDNYANLPEILKRYKLPKAEGLLLDLGFSLEQIEKSGRGFSFKKEEPLLMTYSDKEKPVRQWLKELTEKELTEIIRQFGEERYAWRIAKAIKKNLPITTSKKLAEVIEKSVPASYKHNHLHPATKTFQALRIFANRELENLQLVLKKIKDILKPGGRLAVISFHSLEDRIVKKVFQEMAKKEIVEILTKKPIRPSAKEIKINPHSRSAKLRAIVMRNYN